jgi:hypothetical protein
MNKINIFGSCYSRELFNYTKEYEVESYVLQQSLFTLFSRPLEIAYEEAKSVDDTNFKNRMMYYEFNKLGLKSILENKSDYLVVDFADCRYDIYEFDNPKGVKIIYTHDARATFENIKDNPKFKNIERHYVNVLETFSDGDIRYLLEKFITEILKNYRPENIILNRIQMNNEYYENNEKKILENNFHYGRKEFITKIEDIFIELLPECKILNTEEKPILDINHRFGAPHPMHFEDIYYNYRMQLLDDLILDKKNKAIIINNYKKIYEDNVDTIKGKIHNSENDARKAIKVD